MRLFYFVGGPKAGEGDTFFRRLAQVGGVPPGWQIYPHTGDDGKALHLVAAESPQAILDHLAHFGEIYERSEIVEVRDRR